MWKGAGRVLLRQGLIASFVVAAAFIPLMTADAGTVGGRDAQATLTAELIVASSQLSIPSNVQPPPSAWSGNLQAYFSYITTNRGRLCFATQIQTTLDPSACVWGDPNAKRELAVIGDSQAFQWLPALDTWGQQSKWKVLVLAKASCRPWRSSTYLWSDHMTPYPQCPQFDAWVVKTLNRLKPKATIIAAEIGAMSQTTVESRAQIVAGMSQLKRSLAPSRTRLLMFQNTPWFWNVPSSPACLVANESDVDVCAQPRTYSRGGSNVIEEPMRKAIVEIGLRRVARVVPVDNLVCGPSMCPMISGPLVIYIDDSHISNLWVEHVEPALAEMLVTPLKGV